MKRLHYIVSSFLLATLMNEYTFAQSVDLTKKSGFSRVGIGEQFTEPLHNNLSMFVTFTYLVCGFMGLIGGLRIYTRWQLGESERITTEIWRWAAAILAVIAITTGLSAYVSEMEVGSARITQQDFGINP
ncbi:DUF4134 family protein [Runella zeae]|uniref:DUF4134 family protein n=1 Tax=Runella zeae TaxID=94255 RepID=UPI000A02D8F3|nr:DUF4134 family protein [Runella zeae]